MSDKPKGVIKDADATLAWNATLTAKDYRIPWRVEMWCGLHNQKSHYTKRDKSGRVHHYRNWLFMWHALIECIDNNHQIPDALVKGLREFSRAELAKSEGGDFDQYHPYPELIEAAIDVNEEVALGLSRKDALATVAKRHGIKLGKLRNRERELRALVTDPSSFKL